MERDPHNYYTETGNVIGAAEFKPIAVADSKISFVGSDPTKQRAAQSFPDRYSERITFQNNGTLQYDKSTRYGFVGSWSEADRIKADVETLTFYKDRGIVFDSSKVKSGGYYSYLIQSSPSYDCFVFRGTFGDTQKTGRVGSAGDQAIMGGICYKAGAKSLDAVEREMTDLLARARYDDGVGNRAQAAIEPATLKIARPDIGVFVTCYSQRLDVLYRARACSTGDQTVSPAKRAEISARLRQQRSATAPSDGVPFAPAPAGTTVYSGVSGYIEIVAVDDMQVTTINAAGEISHRFGLFDPLPIEAQLDARAPEGIWPLVVGKEISFARSRDDSKWQETIKVVRTEHLTVPAGTFDTYVVERHTLGMGGNDFDGTSMYWYAPSVGDIVKYDVTVKSGTPTPGNTPWEATRIVGPGDT
jgi:hypothetical protein